MIAWLLAACAARMPLAELAERPISLSVEAPRGDAFAASSLLVRVKGTGADRVSNDHYEIAPGVTLQCEQRERQVGLALVVHGTARAGVFEANCPVGGVRLELELEVRR